MIDDQSREYAKRFMQDAGVFRRHHTEDHSPRSHNNDLVPTNDTKLTKSESAPVMIGRNVTIEQRVRHEEGDHTFRNILLFLVVAGALLFAVDLHKEMHKN